MGYGSATRVKRAGTQIDGERDRGEWHARATELYEDLRKPAVRLVRRAYGQALSESEIEDVYSNAWLGALRALERKHSDLDDEEIRSYLLTAVANHASKEMRRRKRKPIAPLEAAGSVAEVADTPEEMATIKESGAITRDLLSSLPTRRRAVMLLRYGWGLEPTEICDMVEGLSPRAYRKEITKGVDDLVRRIAMVDEGKWCEEREPVLKAYASGMASKDQSLQAERHMAHCRSCSEFVGKLSGHLHDIGSSLLLPAALDAQDGHAGFLVRLRDLFDHGRDSVTGVFSRSDASEGVAVANGARGAGAASAGVLAKVSGLGSGAKAALACAGGALAASACVAVGVTPFDFSTSPDRPLGAGPGVSASLDEAIDEARQPKPDVDPQPPAPRRAPDKNKSSGRDRGKTSKGASEPVLDSSTPPTAEEFGVESAAAPVGAPPAQTDPGSGSGAIQEEFGP